MSEEKQYSKQQLIKSLKFVYELLKYELNANSKSKESVNELTKRGFHEINDHIQLQDVSDLEEEGDYILRKKLYDYDGLKAVDHYRYNNDRLFLFRNFLMLLYFMRTLYSPDAVKSLFSQNIFLRKPAKEDKGKKNNSQTKLLEQLFLIKHAGEDGETIMLNPNIQESFFDQVYKIFRTQAHIIDFNFLTAFNRIIKTTSNESNKKKNITKFCNAFTKLLALDNQSIISLFFEVYGNEFGHMDIPQSMVAFLRYYTYNDALQTPSNPKTNSLYMTGIGTSNIIAKFIGDIQGADNDKFQNQTLELATDDYNPLSKRIRTIYNQLLTDQPNTLEHIKNYPLLKSLNLKFDVVISVVPKKLDMLLEHEAIEKYPFYPKHQISMYSYYNKVIEFTRYKSLMIVPISFISTNAYSTKMFAEDIEIIENGDLIGLLTIDKFDPILDRKVDIETKKKTIKTTTYQDFLHHYQMGKIIEQRKIKKIMLLPKKMFYHTDEQCVLIELTKEENSGIQFIDITNVDYLIERNGSFMSINNNPRLKHIYDAYNVPTLFVNTNAQLVNETSGNAILVSKFISYDEITTSSNLLPTYHLKHQHTHEDERQQEITEYFDVIKLQKFTVDSSSIKDENVDVGYFSQSEFSAYGITSNDELTNIVKTKIKKDNKRVDRLYRVYNNDILIYVHYKDRKDMTMVQINNDDICIGMHNLIAIRLKAEYQKQDGYAKALFLWLMSNNGQEALKSITKTNSANRPLISIEDLKMLQVDMSDLDDAKASFRKMANEIVKIKKSIKSIKDLIG